MRVLLIDGGRRADGESRALLLKAQVLLEAKGHEGVLFWPVNTPGLQCANCGACRGRGMCVADPRAGEFLRDASPCGALLLFCPAGLLGPDIHVKNLLERAALLAPRRQPHPFAGKRAAALVLGRHASSRASAQAAALLRDLGCEVLPGAADLESALAYLEGNA